MSADILSLSRARKVKVRAAERRAAAENRALHGRSRAETARDAADAERRSATLDGARREPPAE